MKQRGGDCCILNHFLPFSFHLDSRSRINPAHGNKNNCESLLIIFHFFCFFIPPSRFIVCWSFCNETEKNNEMENFVINRFFFCFSPDGLLDLRRVGACNSAISLAHSLSFFSVTMDASILSVKKVHSRVGISSRRWKKKGEEKKNHHLDANDVSRWYTRR